MLACLGKGAMHTYIHTCNIYYMHIYTHRFMQLLNREKLRANEKHDQVVALKLELRKTR